MSMSDHVTQLCKSINWLEIAETSAEFVHTLILIHVTIQLGLSFFHVWIIAIVLFNGISKRDLRRVQKLQNKCARLIMS